MKPTEWLKVIFEATGGAKYPGVSLVFFLSTGCLFSFLLWRIGASASAKDRATAPQTGQATQVNTTKGPASPILLNNSGNVTISNDNPEPRQSSTKEKPK